MTDHDGDRDATSQAITRRRKNQNTHHHEKYSDLNSLIFYRPHRSTSSVSKKFLGLLLVLLCIKALSGGMSTTCTNSDPDSSSCTEEPRESNLNLFERCSDPSGSTDNTNDPICVFFHPTTFFQEGNPGYSYIDELTEPYALNYRTYTWQINNWEKDFPMIRPRRSGPLSSQADHPVTSIMHLGTPKAGTRSQYTFFLDNLCIPRVNIQIRPRTGTAETEYLGKLKQMQRTERESGSNKRENIVFAVIRNPVSRFFSAFRQILSMRGSARCSSCAVFEPCVQEPIGSTQQVLKCAIETVKKHGFFEMHLIPSAIFLNQPLLGEDIEVAVFPIEHMGLITNEFVDNMVSHSNHGESKMVDPEFENLAKGITNALKEEGVVDQDMIKDICELYKVDVFMMRYLGFAVKYCDDVQ